MHKRQQWYWSSWVRKNWRNKIMFHQNIVQYNTRLHTTWQQKSRTSIKLRPHTNPTIFFPHGYLTWESWPSYDNWITLYLRGFISISLAALFSDTILNISPVNSCGKVNHLSKQWWCGRGFKHSAFWEHKDRKSLRVHTEWRELYHMAWRHKV